MPLNRLDTWPKFLTGNADLSLWMDEDGKIVNTPDNLWPNSSLSDIGEDGVPVGHDLDIDIAELDGWHYLLSRSPDITKDPPVPVANRQESLARQNAATIPMTEGSMVHQGVWIPGHQPEATSRVVPPTPDVETARNDSKGFAAGTYGLAIGWSSDWGPAGVGAYVFFNLGAAEYPVIPRPDSIPAGARTLDIAMTRREGNSDTGRYQRKIPVEKLTDDLIKVFGPWRNRGKPPALGQNKSGVPKPKAPRRKDYGTMPSDYSTLAGRWSPAIQFWLPSLPGASTGGTARASLVGAFGPAIVVKGDRYRQKVSGTATEPVALAAEASQEPQEGQQGGQQGSITPEGGEAILGPQAADIEQEQVSGADNPDGWENQKEIRNPQRDVQGDWDKVPKWMLDMMPGNFGGGKGDGSTVKSTTDDSGNGTGGGGAGGGGEPEEFHYEWKQSAYKEKTALYFRLPKMVRKDQRERLRGLKATFWWKHESEAGIITWYRAYDSRRGPTSYFDDADAFDGRIECPGLPSGDTVEVAPTGTGEAAAGAPVSVNKRGRGPRVRLIAEEVPTEDTTMIEPPDPTSPPETPTIGGVEALPAGRYAVAVVGSLKGGGNTKRSRAGIWSRQQTPVTDPPTWLVNQYVDITNSQTVKVVPATSISLLKNAEGGQVGGQGLIEDWTPRNTAAGQPGFIRPDDGVWRIWTSTTTSEAPEMTSRVMKVTDDMILTFVCTLGLKGSPAPVGLLRASIRQLDENRKVIPGPNLLIGELGVPGEATFTKRLALPDRDARTRFVEFQFAMIGASVNMDGYIKDMRVFPFDADIGKYLEGEAGEPADFNPSADTPAPSGSFVAVGEAPIPAGGAGEEVPPLLYTGFEAGNLGGLTLLGSSPDKGIISPGPTAIQQPIFGASSMRLQDTSTSVAHTAYLEATVSAVLNSSVALRALYQFYLRPTLDQIRFHYLTTPQGNHAAYFRMDPNGQISLYVMPSGQGGVQTIIPLGFGVGDGGKLDLEVVLVPRKNGLVTVNAATGNRQRETIFQETFNFENRTGHVVRPGVGYGGSANNRWTVWVDQVVVTRSGDILDREKPAPPQGAGFPVPVEERPLKPTGTTPRRKDAAGATINQLRAFLNLGEGVERMPLLDDPINVRPGVNYCVAAFSRWQIINLDHHAAIELWLESEDPDLPRRLISSLPDMIASRDWNPVGRPREDDYAVFRIPDPPEDSPGYTKLVPEARLCPGFFMFQEFLCAQESPSFTVAQMGTFSARDNMRRFRRATHGYGEWILPTVPEHVGTGATGPMPGWWLSEIGVKEIPTTNEAGLEVGSLTASFETSSDGVDWEPYSDPGQRARRLMRYRLDLTSDGVLGPSVPAGGIYNRSWTPVATLTRADGSPFPGGAYVGGTLWMDSYPQMDPRRVGDRLAPVPLSDVVNRLSQGFTVAVLTEDALEEIGFLSRVGRLRLEVPGMDNRVPGMALIVRCEEGIEFEAHGYRRVERFYGVPRHLILATGGTEYAEVLQSGRLQRPMGPSILLDPTAAVVASP